MALEEDELETGSESESEVEEDAVTRFADGSRPLRVCMRFLGLQLGRPVRVCGDRCTFPHSWIKLHPDASAHEHGLASYLPDRGCGGGEWARGEGAGRERGAEAAVQFDGVVAIPVDNRVRWLAVPFFQFIDKVMDIPVVRAALVLAVYNCAEDRGDSCGVPVLFNDKSHQSRF